MPFILPSAAAFIAALISSALVSFLSSTDRSTSETTGVGTRIAMPSSLPSRSGITRLIALAAPVEVGMMFSAAARPRRKSLWSLSRRRWSPVYEWIVVIKPRTIPNSSLMIFTNGARQFVVQLAFETIRSDSGL